MAKVLIITYYWPPAGGAGVQRWLHFAKHLTEFGWDPVVLTVAENKATYPQTDSSLAEFVSAQTEVIRTNSFEPLSLYGKLFGQKKIPFGGFSNAKKTGRISRFIRGNFFVPDARKGWNKYAIKAAKERIYEGNIDTIVTTGPPHSTHLIGLELKKKYRIPWVVDLRDPWTKVFYNKYLKRLPFAVRKDQTYEREVLLNADMCITVSNGFAKSFKKIVSREYHILTNGFSGNIQSKVESTVERVPIVTYVGTMADSYEPYSLIQALSNNHEKDFKIRIAGNLSHGIEDLIINSELGDRVEYLGYLNYNAASEEMLNSDLLILLTPAGKAGEGILPGKFFEYLKCRVPIICLCDNNQEIRDVLEETGVGKAFSRSEEKEMTHYISEVLSGHFKINPELQVNQYERKNLTRKLALLLDKCMIKSK